MRALRRGRPGRVVRIVTGEALSADRTNTPTARGYRQPAEWAPHEATWISWPHNRDSWPGVFAGVDPAMVAFVRALAECEPVYINVLGAEHEQHVRKLLAPAVPPERMRLFPLSDQRRVGARSRRDLRDARRRRRSRGSPSTSTTTRGAASIRRSISIGEIGRQMAEALGVPRYAKPGIVLEGGSIEVNGDGRAADDRAVPAESEPQPVADARRHRDAAARLVRRAARSCGSATASKATTPTATSTISRASSRPTNVVTVVESNRADPNHAPLAANRQLLDTLSVGGRPLEIVELPMPEPQYLEEQRLPASYANFYVANGAVLVPMFGCPADDVACGILARLLSGPAHRARRLPRAHRGVGRAALPHAAGARRACEPLMSSRCRAAGVVARGSIS